jgi:Protein of unknown function (DUF3105)
MGVKRNRDERKDRAAAQRAAQQARDRHQRRIVYGTAIPLAVVIIGLVPLNNWYQAHQRGKKHGVGYVTAASGVAKAAGCTGVRNDRQIPTSLVKAGTTVDYAALTAQAGQDLPPTSGPREATPLPDKPQFYAFKSAPRPERAVGNLDHGYVVVWYDSKLPAADVKILQNAVASNSRTLVVPWTRSVFPDGKHVVLTAWDRTQRCTKASADVMSDFANTYRDADPAGQDWGSPTAPTPSQSSSATNPTAAPTVVPTAVPTTVPTTAVPSLTPTPSAPSANASAPVAVTSSPGSLITVTPVR